MTTANIYTLNTSFKTSHEF